MKKQKQSKNQKKLREQKKATIKKVKLPFIIRRRLATLNIKVIKLTTEIGKLNKTILLLAKKQKLINKQNKIDNQNQINKQNKVNFILNRKRICELNKSGIIALKHFPSSVREWNNSVYLYNKNGFNLIPFTTIYAMKLIKSFFNLYNNNLEKQIRSKRLLLRLRRLSSSRIYLSNGEFKHTNNNVLINIYIFNRQKYNYLSKLKEIYLKELFTREDTNNIIARLLVLTYKKSIESIKEVNQNKYSLIKALDVIEKNDNYKIGTFKYLSSYVVHFYKNVLNLTMKRLRLYFLFKQLIYINKSKLNYTYLRLLKKHLENLYNKNVEFNLINLKRFYLNSDILSESVKLKITRNKNKMRKILNVLKDKVKIHRKKRFLGPSILTKNNLNEINDPTSLKNTVIDSLKYKHITGFRLEAKGRLSKRFTASRSVYKLKYKGNLLNLDSSYRGLSSVILKGNLKSNIQYSKVSSITRIGSFGLKGWISSN